jgi:hypothetical protein
MMIFYAISQLAMKYFGSKPQAETQTPSTTSYDQSAPSDTQGGANPWQLDPQMINPVWPMGSKIALHVYLSQSFGYDMFSKNERKANGKLPSVTWDNLTWGDWSWSRSADYTVDMPLVSR